VFCEGEGSEPDYINALKRLPEIANHASLRVEIAPRHGAPMTLVRDAMSRATDGEVDECWCIFDVEWPKHHPNLIAAKQLVRDHKEKVKLAISNPCFELWLILHYEDQTTFLDTKSAVSKSKKLDGRSGKHINGARYMNLRHEAVRRAKELARKHEGDGTIFPDDNPSSGMSEFLCALGLDKLPQQTTN
jgi:hypothetical protein